MSVFCISDNVPEIKKIKNKTVTQNKNLTERGHTALVKAYTSHGDETKGGGAFCFNAFAEGFLNAMACTVKSFSSHDK